MDQAVVRAAEDEADSVILPLAKELQEITPEHLEDTRRYLIAGLRRHLDEWRTDLTLAAHLHARRLDRYDPSRIVRAFMKWHDGTQPAMKAEAGRDGEWRDAMTMTRRFNLALRTPVLWVMTVLCLLAVAGAGMLDYGLVSGLIKEGTRGDYDEQRLTEFELVTTSLATIGGYTLMGIAWHCPGIGRALAILIYGVIFAWLAAYNAADLGAHAGWSALAWAGLKTALYTLPGLLLCLAEHALWRCGERLYARRETAAAEAHDDAARAIYYRLEHEENDDDEAIAGAVEHILWRSRQKARVVYARFHRAAQDALADPETSEEGKAQAESQRVRAANYMAALDRMRDGAALMLALSLTGLFAGCNDKPPLSAEEIIAKRPRQVIAVDYSQSSPALNPDYVRQWFPYGIDPSVRKLDLGSDITIIGMGDRSRPPIEYTTRLMRKATPLGLPKDQAVQWVHDRLLQLPDEVKAKPHLKSELIAGLYEAAKLLKPHAVRPNTLTVISDGREESSFAFCSPASGPRPAEARPKGAKRGAEQPRAKRACRLPTPHFKFENTEVIWLGIGYGLTGERALELEAEWRQFFTTAGVKPEAISFRQ